MKSFELSASIGKSFVACLANSSRGEGRIRLLELLSEQQDEAKLIDYGDLAISNCQALGGFSSLTFDVFSKILAISTESGEIIVWDMHLGKEIRRITADECGVTSLKFRNTESLISIGVSYILYCSIVTGE